MYHPTIRRNSTLNNFCDIMHCRSYYLVGTYHPNSSTGFTAISIQIIAIMTIITIKFTIEVGMTIYMFPTPTKIATGNLTSLTLVNYQAPQLTIQTLQTIIKHKLSTQPFFLENIKSVLTQIQDQQKNFQKIKFTPWVLQMAVPQQLFLNQE